MRQNNSVTVKFFKKVLRLLAKGTVCYFASSGSDTLTSVSGKQARYIHAFMSHQEHTNELYLHSIIAVGHTVYSSWTHTALITHTCSYLITARTHHLNMASNPALHNVMHRNTHTLILLSHQGTHPVPAHHASGHILNKCSGKSSSEEPVLEVNL